MVTAMTDWKEPLPCPWYVPSLKVYGFVIQHSCLGDEIATVRSHSRNLPGEIALCLFILLPLGLFAFFPGQLWAGGVCLGLFLLIYALVMAVQIRYKPHFDLPKCGLYRGINRFDCPKGQFDPLLFDDIRALQIVPTGKKRHCQLVALRKDGSRKLLLHGDYYQLLRFMIYDNVKGRAVFPAKPPPCFLNAVAPIWDGAQFPLGYTPDPEPVEQEPYLPPTGVNLFAPEELEQFNRNYEEHGFDDWAALSPLPLYLRIDAFETWPIKLAAAGIKTTVDTIDLYLGCGRSLDTTGFDGLKLSVEFHGKFHSLSLFMKSPFPDSGKVEACFYSENTELLAALKNAGLEES